MTTKTEDIETVNLERVNIEEHDLESDSTDVKFQTTLAQSIKLKRMSSDNERDAISAEEIGDFSEESLTESLQRVTRVRTQPAEATDARDVDKLVIDSEVSISRLSEPTPTAISLKKLSEVVLLDSEDIYLNLFRSTKPLSGLTNLAEHIPNILVDVRYFGTNNFTGATVDGYLSNKALLSRQAVQALLNVQLSANEMDLGLKVFDAYRPQRAVDQFLHWVDQPDAPQLKAEYYPNIEKTALFREGYLAERSSHSRGSTIDLTLVSLKDSQELDMGTGFDFFDSTSWAESDQVSIKAQENRRLLRTLMMEQGFEPFESEWWHFTLKDEPYPNQYFDFPVQ